MNAYAWYAELAKPSWAPPSWLFGPVWTVLYVIIALSFGYVFWQAAKKRIPRKVAVPFALNLLFNAAFTPLQFGLRSNALAALDILAVLATLVWAIVAVRRHAPWVAWVQTPYLLWVSFATVLQLTITAMNA